ncbi:MAG TPA: hypothetical protein VL307_00770, partial [Chitinophagaceae bacterium]|nr:hypothetical protein [Chitinophagaceae bacterium]
SFNDGGDWQPLRLNMPATSIRDLVIKDNDIVVGTHGRSFWILDDIVPLRDLARKNVQASALYSLAPAYRVRWNMNTDTPLPQEVPAGENPPDGAIIDYTLEKDMDAPVTLQIKDSSGQLVCQFSSADKPYDLPPVNIPLYWIRPQQILSSTKGAHRFIWNLHWQPLPLPVSYSIAAVYGQTPPNTTSPWVMPGRYQVILNAGAKTYTQPLLVVMDPRVKTSKADLQTQFALSHQCYTMARQCIALQAKMDTVQQQATKLSATASGALADSLQALKNAIALLQEGGRDSKRLALAAVQSNALGLMAILQESDSPVTTQAREAISSLLQQWKAVNAACDKILQGQVSNINKQLAQQQREKIIL